MERANRMISALYRYGQRYLACKLRPAGLDVGLLPALMQTCRFPGITQERITYHTGMDKGTTARSIKQLKAQGLVIRLLDEKDRRVNHIFPTERGLAVYPKADEALAGLHQVLYQGFSDEEIQTAAALLRRMQENIAACVGRAAL